MSMTNNKKKEGEKIGTDFKHAYTSLKKKAQEVSAKEIPLKPINPGISLVILVWGMGIILIMFGAGGLVAGGAGLLAASAILYTTIVAGEFRKGKEKPKREPRKKEGKQKTIDEIAGDGSSEQP